MQEAVNFDGVRSVYRWPQRVLRLLLPSVCLVCAEAGTADCDLCPACRAALPDHGHACLCCATQLYVSDGALRCGHCLQHPPPLQRVHACFTYRWPVDGLLRRFKFHQDLPAGRLLSELMAKRCADLLRPQALLPVSLHRQRLRQRGYDQALELAQTDWPRAAVALPAVIAPRAGDRTAIGAGCGRTPTQCARCVRGAWRVASACGVGGRRDDDRCHAARGRAGVTPRRRATGGCVGMCACAVRLDGLALWPAS